MTYLAQRYAYSNGVVRAPGEVAQFEDRFSDLGTSWVSVGAGANKTPFCLRQGEVAVIALNRSYLDGKCWLERQKVLRNGAHTAKAEYQLRADSNLLDEIQKRSALRRREVARGMIGIERIEFFRPFRQGLNKLASRQ